MKNKDKPLIFIFVACLVYWTYLFFFSSMSIVYDAQGYEELGEKIYKKGWIEFFQTGPNREPLYPLSIAISMRLADIFNIPYQKVQTLFQMLILACTQILILLTLKKLKLHKTIIYIILLYAGFSPAILNSGLSLFSEIMTYPFVLGIILISAKSWQELIKDSPELSKVILLALTLSLLLIFVTSVKAIFEFVAVFLLLSFMLLCGLAALKNKKKILWNSFLWISLVFLVFFSYMHLYKLTNQKYNGQYVFTDRGAWMLYGTVERRISGKFTLEKLFPAVAMIPGDGVCNAIYGYDKCLHWTHVKTQELGVKKIQELEGQNVLKDDMDRKLISLSMQEILKEPFEYALFHLLEWMRIFFWESTQISFVIYPYWLEKLYAFMPLKNGLRLLSGCLSGISFLFLFFLVIKNRALLFQRNARSEIYSYQFFILLLIFVFTQLYAFFCILTRYSFPMIPLYLLSMAIFLDFLFTKNK